MKLLLPLLCVASLVACGAPPQSTEPGIYNLTTQRLADTCTPLRAEAEGETAVAVQGEVVSLMVPSGGSGPFRAMQRYEIPLGGVHTVMTLSLAGCGRAMINTDVEVLQYGQPLVVSVRKVFSHVQPPTGSCFSEVPSADCQSELHFTYALAEECPSECSVRGSPGAPLRCECPDAGR